jgi:hypothetical protein
LPCTNETFDSILSTTEREWGLGKVRLGGGKEGKKEGKKEGRKEGS